MASSVKLGDKLEAAIDGLVRTGRYGSRSEVLREGVRLVQEREAKWKKFEEAIDRGIADAKAGRSTPIKEAFAEIRAMIDDIEREQEDEKRAA